MKLIKGFSIIIATVLFLVWANAALAGYDPVIGRFQQQDPVGTGPRVVFTSNGPKFVGLNGPVPHSAQIQNTPHIVNGNRIQFASDTQQKVDNTINTVEVSQYIDGMNLYEYAKSNPLIYVDPFGLKQCNCGPDITGALQKLNSDISLDWNSSSIWKKIWKCSTMFNPISGWDIHALGPGSSGPTLKCYPSGKACKKTVTVCGNCYPNDAVNYWLWGRINKFCGRTLFAAINDAITWKVGAHHHWIDPITKAWIKAGYRVEFCAGEPTLNKVCKPSPESWVLPLPYTWGL